MPRSYRLGRRAEQVAATRARIVEAAIALYAERGVSRTTMQEVARRADVAPGTVLNHFPTPDDLATAAAERIVEDLRVPEPALLDGIDDPRDRLGRLTHELATFYERGESWWQIYQREPGPIPGWTAVEARVAGAARGVPVGRSRVGRRRRRGRGGPRGHRQSGRVLDPALARPVEHRRRRRRRRPRRAVARGPEPIRRDRGPTVDGEPPGDPAEGIAGRAEYPFVGPGQLDPAGPERLLERQHPVRGLARLRPASGPRHVDATEVQLGPTLGHGALERLPDEQTDGAGVCLPKARVVGGIGVRPAPTVPLEGRPCDELAAGVVGGEVDEVAVPWARRDQSRKRSREASPKPRRSAVASMSPYRSSARRPGPR